MNSSNKNDQNNEQEHGALVKKILESKEQLEYGSELNRQKDFVNFLNKNYQKKIKILIFLKKKRNQWYKMIYSGKKTENVFKKKLKS
jgi:hypothetical protein